MKPGAPLVELEAEKQVDEKEMNIETGTGYYYALDFGRHSVDAIYWEDTPAGLVECGDSEDVENKLGWAAKKSQWDSLTGFADGHDANTVPEIHFLVFVADEQERHN